MRRVIDLGGDTDTVGCVVGGLLGAVKGIQAIPSRWTTPLNGKLPGQPDGARDLADLQDLAVRLDGGSLSSDVPEFGAGIEPKEVLPGIWLCDLPGAIRAPADAVVISLCRTFGYVAGPGRLQVYLLDNDRNLDVAAVLCDVLDTIEAVHADGRPVLVHCHGGGLAHWHRATRLVETHPPSHRRACHGRGNGAVAADRRMERVVRSCAGADVARHHEFCPPLWNPAECRLQLGGATSFQGAASGFHG